MNSQEYKKICDLKNVFGVAQLQEMLRLLKKVNAESAALITDALENGRIPRLDLHGGTEFDDYCKVSCSVAQADKIVEILFEAEADSVPVSGEATGQTHMLVNLVNKWSDYREELERGHL